MDLSNLKNIDVKDILAKLKSGGIGDKKLLIKFGVGFISILVFLIAYYAVISPKVSKQKEQINIMNGNKNKIEEFKNDIITLKASIKELEPEYKKNSKLFTAKKEREHLTQSIKNYATLNSLKITHFKKLEPINVTEANINNEGTDQTSENSENQQTMYLKIPVDYEIRGNFLGYLKFRRALASSLKVINFDKEEISVLKEGQGKILSKLTISIVGLPNEYK